MLKDSFIKEMVEVFKALADANRLRIIRMLASNMEKTICVSDLAEKLGITQPAASQQIKVLRNIGILEGNKDGYYVYYAINTDILNKYKEQIDQMFELAFTKCPQYGTCKGHDK